MTPCIIVIVPKQIGVSKKLLNDGTELNKFEINKFDINPQRTRERLTSGEKKSLRPNSSLKLHCSQKRGMHLLPIRIA